MMPAGVSWPKYLSVVGASLASMLAGAQFVHQIYHPLDDLDDLVQQEVEKMKRQTQGSTTNGLS